MSKDTKALIKQDDVVKELSGVGFDFTEELDNMETTTNTIELPYIRIEHRKNGEHRLYIDFGENYSGLQEEDIKGNAFEAVIFGYQTIRALWEEGRDLPLCSGVGNFPSAFIKDPIHTDCKTCPQAIIGEGKCKPKVRLWLLMKYKGEITPFIFAVTPTSIKHWNKHVKMLKRSKLPVVAVSTAFSLEDVKKNAYRWAEVNFNVAGKAPKDMLLMAKEARDTLKKIMTEINKQDFAEPGDKQEDSSNGFDNPEKDFGNQNNSDLPF